MQNEHQRIRDNAPQTFQNQNQEQPKSVQLDAYLLLHDLVYILAAVTVLFVFILRLVTVSGPSMTSTLLDKDYVAVLSNIFYQNAEDGDIIVAKVPTFDEKPIVKRVIATQGQTVDIQYNGTNGAATVYVDGTPLEEPYINETMHEQSYPMLSFPVTVPEDCVFVMGDNRNHSADSRYTQIGMFNTKYIIGKVLLVAWPGQRDETDSRDFSRIGAVS